MGNIIYLGSAKPSSGSGGGGSITVDQTYDATSTNAQSGTAVAQAVANVSAYQPFPAGWTTNSTVAALMADITADTTATKGKAYLGEVTCSDLPFVGNAEMKIEIMDNVTGIQGKVIYATLSSGNTSPYFWQYTYWNNQGSGWQSFIPTGGAIENTATGSNALTILGVAGIGANGINIGTGSRGAYNGVAIGNTAATYGGSDIAIGQNATSNLGDAIVIGHNAESFSPYTVTMGFGSINGGSAAVDDATESIAIGMYAINRHQDSIALGCRAVSSADKQFMVGFGLDQSDNPLMYELLDGTSGKIPNARINAMVGATSLAAGSAGLVPAPTTADVDKYLKGDGTWGAVSGGGIQNTTASAGSIGLITSNSVGTDAFVFGNQSEGGNGSICMGLSSACGDDSIALGTWSKALGVCSTAIGTNAYATGNFSIAIGTGAGAYNNNEFVVGMVDEYNSTITYKLLDGYTGKIPNDRIDGATGSFTSQDGKTVTVTNGVITSIV